MQRHAPTPQPSPSGDARTLRGKATPWLAVATLVLVSCGGGSGYIGDPAPPVLPPVFDEQEPNDAPQIADFIGVVDPLTHLYVDGYVDAIGFDVVDHIEFQAAVPMELGFRIDALDPVGDVDVLIYDPLEDLIVAEYALPGTFEFGSVVIHEPGRFFQFVVRAYGIDTPWSLEVRGHPYPTYGAEAGTSEGDAEARTEALAPSLDENHLPIREAPRPAIEAIDPPAAATEVTGSETSSGADPA